MICNQLQDPVCAAAIAADNLAPDNSAEILQMINSSNLSSWFNVYQNNLQGFNVNFSAESGVSFNLAPFLKSLCKAYQLTGDASLLTEMENRIDDLFAMNDQAVFASGLQVTDQSGNNPRPIVPYELCAVPAGFNLNAPYCGWSRWAPNWLSGVCPDARARPELLTDGAIICAMMDAIHCMKQCGVLNTTKSAGWLSKIKQILDVWDVQWRENYTPSNPSMGPECTGTVTYSVTGQYIDPFDKPYPLNQQAVFLKADMLYQQCATDRTGAKERARKFIVDWNNHYFITDNAGNDLGWYYASFCNCTESFSDLPHVQISVEFLKAASECGVTGSSATLTRAIESLKDNAYLGGGNWSYYNTGNPAHGTLTNNVASGPWGPGNTVAGCSTTQSFSSGSGGVPQVYRAVLLLSDLPEPLNTDCKTTRDATMTLWTNTDSTVSTGDELNAVFCYLQSLCERDSIVVEPPVTPGCITCQVSDLPNVNQNCGRVISYAFVPRDRNGNAITSGVTLEPAQYVINQPVWNGTHWTANLMFPCSPSVDITMQVIAA